MISNIDVFKNVYTKDFAYLIGSLLGDGCLYVGKDTYQFSITSEDFDFCEKCQIIMSDLFKKGGKIKAIEKEGKISYYQLVICSKKIVFFLKDLTESKTKIPSFIYKNNSFRKSFTQGIMDSDGWISEVNASDGFKRYRVGFKNISIWADAFKNILDELKVRTGEMRKVSNSRSSKKAFTFTINTLDYCKKVGFRINRKKKKQEEFIGFYKNKTKIKKIKKKENVILRVSDFEHRILKNKSSFFGMKKSAFLRHCALSYWKDNKNINDFKKMLQLYLSGNELEKQEIVEILFQYYRNNGFPHNVLSNEQKENRMGRIIKSKDILLEDNNLQMNFNGLDLANSYHPHMMEAHYSRGENSPMETYNNDDGLKDCINRWLELGKVPNHAGMRRILKTRDGTKGVVNFKPSISKFIYDNYCPVDGKVLDPCSGYSGRLAGCIASNRNLFYHGIDPNGKTAIGNMEMASFFSTQYDILGERIYKYKFRFDLGMAEDILPGLEEKYDLVFTSPPYFNVEIYSEDKSQSCNRYQEYEIWLQSFLYSIVDQSKRLLKEDGYLILNAKNLPGKKMADDLCKYCEKDWELETTYHMRLANSEYNRKNGETFHIEPIFVFKKK